MAESQTVRTSSEKYKHGDTCRLFNPMHTIPSEVAKVVETLREMDGIEAVSGCCNACTTQSLTNGNYYISQYSTHNIVKFGYTSELAAHALIGVCKQLGVPCDWAGNTDERVAVGTLDAH